MAVYRSEPPVNMIPCSPSRTSYRRSRSVSNSVDSTKSYPLVILINRYSASASEIVSACLQDHKRAVVVGERTWGKGSVQNVIELDGGKSALKLTTASYHRPSGKNIHRFPKATEKDEWGVMPDAGYDLKMTDQEIKDLFKSRLDREIIHKEGDAPKSTFVDKQLDAGLEVIKKQLAEGNFGVVLPGRSSLTSSVNSSFALMFCATVAATTVFVAITAAVPEP